MAPAPTQEKVRFGLFVLDMKTAELTKNGTIIRVPQQSLRLLSALLESPGEIVTREKLRQRLWPSDVFIDFDHGLNKSMQKLRDALGDSAGSPRYIETIPRVGYRFIAPVQSETPSRVAEADSSIVQDRPLETPVVLSVPPTPERQRRRWVLPGTGIVLLCVTLAVAVYLSFRPRPVVTKYTPLTDFTDSATAPALSPDGHMLAFIRGESPFMSAGQIYVKMLPDGEARARTHDKDVKYNLTFSPDGSQIAYTVLERSGFATYSLSVLGGEPHLLLSNAAGLTWLDPHHFLFSRFRSGVHLGVVTEATTGEDLRELYFPPHERGMAHYSFASPDRQNALVVVMDGQGDWSMCQLISIAGTSPPRAIGPNGQCTSAGWSPDSRWMYFIASVDSRSHIWRQRYPDGSPEQITFGPSEEAGLASEQDGRSLITSIGEEESSIWLHDAAGERSLSSEGEIAVGNSPPSFRENDKIIYYLLRHQDADRKQELRRLILDNGQSEPVLPGTSVIDYDVSLDGKQVVYTRAGSDGKSQMLIASIDRSSPARHIGRSGETMPHFGRQGQILFCVSEGNLNYLEQMNGDGTRQSKVLPYSIIEVQGISPARKWLTATASYPEGNTMIPMVVEIPLDGGSPRRVCASYCKPVWSSTGKFLFIPVEASSPSTPGRSLAVPVGPGETLPEFPHDGIQQLAEPSAMSGAQSIGRAELVPGEDLKHYAYVSTTVHRNLYRVTLP